MYARTINSLEPVAPAIEIDEYNYRNIQLS